MTDGHIFISYSTADALEFARQLADELAGGEDKFIKTWFDKRDIDPARDWDDQIVEGIRACKCMLFVMTRDSTAPGSVCKNEWTYALKYKKPVAPLRLHRDVEQPFGLGNRQWIDFTGEFEAGLAKTRRFIRRLDSPAGQLDALKDRLADAQRDLRRAEEADQPRIRAEIDELNEQLKRQAEIVQNPQAAAEKTRQNIESGLERERRPEQPAARQAFTRFINPPPGITPHYFQDRLIETQQMVSFLKDEAQRLLTIVGRAGIGKTAMVCRLLKALENGELPDGLGALKVDGIVYLSETGSHKINFANIFADLSKLLPPESREPLEAWYKDPQTASGDKMRALLDAFPGGRVMLLLDNFEPLVDPESLNLRDGELGEALKALLCGPHHAVKVLITTRIAPRDLALCEPGRQQPLSLDEGLTSPYAENVLREMDRDGRLGLKNAPEALLNQVREKTRGYPRALEAFYAILSVDRYTTLAELLEMKLPGEVVEKLVGEAFSRLDPTAQKVMQALAVFNRPVTPAALDYLLQPHQPGIDSAPGLNRLVNMHFARREAGRYYLHPADREYAFGLIPVDAPLTTPPQEQGRFAAFTQHDLTQRAADYFAQARKPRAEWKKLDDLAAQLAEFDLRCAAGAYDTAAQVMEDIDYEYLLKWGHYSLLIKLYELVRGKISDPRLEQRCLNELGLAYDSIGQTQKAISYYEEALSVVRARKDRGYEGVLLGNLGNCYYALGQTGRAVELYEQALAIRREIGDRRGEGSNLTGLGNCYADLGQTGRAIEYYEQALAIQREIGDRRGEGSALGNLGNCYYALGQTGRAVELYEQALAIRREIGDRRGEGSNLTGLGNCYADLGQTGRAIEYYEQALAIQREIGDRRGEGSDLNNLGSCYGELGDFPRALEYYELALANAREIGNRYGEAKRLRGMADILIDQARYAQALPLLQESLKIGAELNSPEVNSEAYYDLALAHLYAGDLPAARAAAEQARQYDWPQNNPAVLALLGLIAGRQKDLSAAAEAFSAALTQAEGLLAHTPDHYAALEAQALALAGLGKIEEARAAYQAARALNSGSGVVQRATRLLDQLEGIARFW